MADRSEWKQPGGPYPALYNAEAGVEAPQTFDEWWEADPAAEGREWVVRLYKPDTEEVASEAVYEDYYEAMKAAEAEMPFMDVDVVPVQEP